METLERGWFEAAERDSSAAEELEALQQKTPASFTRMKIALACIVAALAMLALPLFR